MDRDNLLYGFRALCRPKILQSANASCLYSATEGELPQFSETGLEDMCRETPYVLISESPDAASANSRKKAASAAKAPKNCFYILGVCDAHQAHRIVAGAEKQCVGDLYSIAVSCAFPEFQNRLQTGARKLIEEQAVFMRGVPDPTVQARNRRVAQHTLRRRVEDESDEFDDDHGVVQRFLSMWNGDWTSGVIVHVCSGCCATAEEASIPKQSWGSRNRARRMPQHRRPRGLADG